MIYHFICEEHREYGSLGWRQKNQPNFDPLGGMAVAHDILEHFPGQSESPADEFLALGAAAIIRGLTSTFDNFAQPEENLASDFEEIFSHAYMEDMGIEEPPFTRKPVNNDLHDLIERTIKQGRKNLKSRCESEETDWTQDIEAFLYRARGWMRIGAARTRVRYRRYSIHEITWLFTEIMREADRCLEHAEEGDELIVQVIGTKATVRKRELQEYEY